MDVCIPLLRVLAFVLKPLVGICGADLSCTLQCENVLAHTEATTKYHWRRLHSPTLSSLEKCLFCLLGFFLHSWPFWFCLRRATPAQRPIMSQRLPLQWREWHKASCCPDWRVSASLLLAAPLPQGSSLVTQREHRSPCVLDNRRLQS